MSSRRFGGARRLRALAWLAATLAAACESGPGSALDGSAGDASAAGDAALDAPPCFEWAQLAAAGTGPSAGSWPVAVYDSTNNRMVVVFGSAEASTPNEVWTLSLAGTPTWSRLSPSGTPPPGRERFSAVYDSSWDRLILFGGVSSGGVLSDTWQLSLAGTPSWARATPSGAPPARSEHTAVYYSLLKEMIVYGGVGAGSQRLGDAWSLSLLSLPDAWTQLTPSGTLPAGRRGHASVADLVRQRMVVFGGETAAGLSDEVWSLDLRYATPAWTSIPASSGALPPRVHTAAVVDGADEQLVVFAGRAASGVLGDVWTLGPFGMPGWRQVAIGGPGPAPREGAAAIHPALRQMLVFGDSGSRADLWSLSLCR